jgi:F0F1-type ATP synthase membrane subunit b/b'
MKARLPRAALGLALGLGVCAVARTAKAAIHVVPGPAVVLAAQGPSNDSERELILDLVNFILLLAALGYSLRKPARDFFAQRTASTRGKLEEGAKALEAARLRLAEAGEKLSGLDEEIAQLKVTLEKDMAAEIRRIRQETSDEVIRIQQFAQAQIGAALRAAKGQLKHFAVRESVEQARTLIGSRLDEKGRRNLVTFFLANLDTLAKRN